MQPILFYNIENPIIVILLTIHSGTNFYSHRPKEQRFANQYQTANGSSIEATQNERPGLTRRDSFHTNPNSFRANQTRTGLGGRKLRLPTRKQDAHCRNLWRTQRRPVLDLELHNTGELQNTEQPFTWQSAVPGVVRMNCSTGRYVVKKGTRKISTPLSDYRTMVEKVVGTWCAVVADELFNEQGDFGTPKD